MWCKALSPCYLWAIGNLEMATNKLCATSGNSKQVEVIYIHSSFLWKFRSCKCSQKYLKRDSLCFDTAQNRNMSFQASGSHMWESDEGKCEERAQHQCGDYVKLGGIPLSWVFDNGVMVDCAWTEIPYTKHCQYWSMDDRGVMQVSHHDPMLPLCINKPSM